VNCNQLFVGLGIAMNSAKTREELTDRVGFDHTLFILIEACIVIYLIKNSPNLEVQHKEIELYDRILGSKFYRKTNNVGI